MMFVMFVTPLLVCPSAGPCGIYLTAPKPCLFEFADFAVFNTFCYVTGLLFGGAGI
jgi:hypothetical protein